MKQDGNEEQSVTETELLHSQFNYYIKIYRAKK